MVTLKNAIGNKIFFSRFHLHVRTGVRAYMEATPLQFARLPSKLNSS